jgi:hypothetical protein
LIFSSAAAAAAAPVQRVFLQLQQAFEDLNAVLTKIPLIHGNINASSLLLLEQKSSYKLLLLDFSKSKVVVDQQEIALHACPPSGGAPNCCGCRALALAAVSCSHYSAMLLSEAAAVVRLPMCVGGARAQSWLCVALGSLQPVAKQSVCGLCYHSS